MISSADEFIRLRQSDDPEEVKRAASGSATEAVWLDIIETYPHMKMWVVYNKTVPVSILRLLSDDSNSDVRLAVAMKRKLDEQTFEKLAHDIDESERERIACNRKTPVRILKLLAKDVEPMVSEAAIKSLADP